MAFRFFKHRQFESLESRRLLSVTPELVADFNTTPAVTRALGTLHEFGDGVAWLVRPPSLTTTLFNFAERDLYISDGTESGTAMVHSFENGVEYVAHSSNATYFQGRSPREAEQFATLWRLDQQGVNRVDTGTWDNFRQPVALGEEVWFVDTVGNDLESGHSVELLGVSENGTPHKRIVLPGVRSDVTPLNESIVIITEQIEVAP